MTLFSALSFQPRGRDRVERFVQLLVIECHVTTHEFAQEEVLNAGMCKANYFSGL